MDETTISDIRQRVARWQKEDKNGDERLRAWMYAINSEDVDLLLREIERLTKENDELRLQFLQAKEQEPVKLIAVEHMSRDEFIQLMEKNPALQVHLKSENPTGLEKYWFNEKLGPFKQVDTYFERSRRWTHGPYDTKEQADVEWRLFLKREKENGKS